MTTRTVVVQKWEESERGWGVRPDGYSLHLNEGARLAFIRDYNAGLPDKVPDEYSRPDGTAYLADVDEETYQRVLSSKYGIRSFGRPPGSQGTDGWRSITELTATQHNGGDPDEKNIRNPIGLRSNYNR